MVSDVNFELYRLHEWQTLMVRTSEHWCEPCQLDAPSHRLGNLGAAAMPLHLALAFTAWRHGYAPHEVALSLAGSDGGERVAAVVQKAS